MMVTGLVLARGGSKGIKNKNLLLLDNKPLLLRCLEVMHEAECKHTVYYFVDMIYHHYLLRTVKKCIFLTCLIINSGC